MVLFLLFLQFTVCWLLFVFCDSANYEVVFCDSGKQEVVGYGLCFVIPQLMKLCFAIPQIMKLWVMVCAL